MIVPVILSGGSGTRLWPLSRREYPKQLLELTEAGSLLQATVKRGSCMDGVTVPLVVCNESYRFMIAEQLRLIDVQPDAIFLEPEGRNSAPAVAAAAFHVQKKHPGALMLVMPSDHVLQDEDLFCQAVEKGIEAAENENFVLFGITPDRPETGYGYIHVDEADKKMKSYPVKEFVEKPDLETAQAYLDSGEYCWNSGIFIFKPSVLLDTLRELEPEMYECCREAVHKARIDLDFVRLHEQSFTSSPAKSIDYAVMERVRNLAVVPFDGDWSDIGSWDSLMKELPSDSDGNVVAGDIVVENVSGSFLHSSGRLIGVVGMENVIVVETADAVLVADRDHSQDVGKLVEKLRRDGRNEIAVHRRVYRPWGSYETVDSGIRFQVKRIIVKPGGVLSLQMHHHRAEHWVVVKGTAKITLGESETLLQEDESTYIPIGTKHRLVNPGKIDLELIEVQTGSYLGEDDIQRFEDLYGRSGDK